MATRRNTSFWRINQNINAPELRVIGPDGHQLGLFSKSEALGKAIEFGLDLVEIAPTAKPPVARIIDFAKFKYQQDKKDREAKLKEKRGTEQKEIWLTPFMADNDYHVRLNRIKEFIGDGFKVRVAIKFTGRQMAHQEFGYELARRVVADNIENSKLDGDPKFLGRQLMMTLSPYKGQKSNNQESAADEKIHTKENAKTEDKKITS